MDATIMRSFQTELFSRFLPVAYVGHVNLAAAKHWRVMPKLKDGSTVEFIFFVFKISFLPGAVASVALPCGSLIDQSTPSGSTNQNHNTFYVARVLHRKYNY